jgi:hypothetical protein
VPFHLIARMHSVWLDAGSCAVAETAELVANVFDRLPDEMHDDALELHINRRRTKASDASAHETV